MNPALAHSGIAESGMKKPEYANTPRRLRVYCFHLQKKAVRGTLGILGGPPSNGMIVTLRSAKPGESRIFLPPRLASIPSAFPLPGGGACLSARYAAPRQQQ